MKLSTESDRTRYKAFVDAQPLPLDVSCGPWKSTKSREQEEKYHALIGEIAKTKRIYGKKLGREAWKRLLIDAFKHDTKDDPDLKAEWAKFGQMQLLPALNHDGFVAIGEQSRRFTVKLAGAFIDWLEAFRSGSDVEVAA